MVVRVRKFNSVMSLLPLHPTLVLSFPCPHKELCDYAFTAPTLLMLPELAASALSLNYGFGLMTIVRKGFRGSTTFLSCVYYQVEKANSFFFLLCPPSVCPALVPHAPTFLRPYTAITFCRGLSFQGNLFPAPSENEPNRLIKHFLVFTVPYFPALTV